MILSNVEILKCLQRGSFIIEPLLQREDCSEEPFNTTSIDLRLSDKLTILQSDLPTAINLKEKKNISRFIKQNSESLILREDQPYILKPNVFVLGQTLEYVDFPIQLKGISYSARVEGKSSIARNGILIHFTAPTIHSNFNGTITLEIINMGRCEFLLRPNMYICQLIIEQVSGCPINAPSQFRGQDNPAGFIIK